MSCKVGVVVMWCVLLERVQCRVYVAVLVAPGIGTKSLDQFPKMLEYLEFSLRIRNIRHLMTFEGCLAGE